eukprot:9426647-Prorocentrum_lima.AAC.1
MTSSLVGSEMCIRDRLWVLRTLEPQVLGALLDVRAPCSRGWLKLSIPVSYTHLTLPTICSV